MFFQSLLYFSETIMFLHQIFYQGLKARIASWPTLVLGKSHVFVECHYFIHDALIQMFVRVHVMKSD